jgi:hypothetical protein
MTDLRLQFVLMLLVAILTIVFILELLYFRDRRDRLRHRKWVEDFKVEWEQEKLRTDQMFGPSYGKFPLTLQTLPTPGRCYNQQVVSILRDGAIHKYQCVLQADDAWVWLKVEEYRSPE